MTGIVIDASVTLSWCFPDEQTPMSLKVLDLLQGGRASSCSILLAARNSQHPAARRAQETHHTATDQRFFRNSTSA